MNFRRSARFPLLCGSAFVAGAALADGAPIREGYWEITTRAEMAGMPAGMMPPATSRVCLTREDLKREDRLLGGNEGKCEIRNSRTSGNTSSWEVVCREPEAMTGSGTFTYQRDGYTGRVVFRIKDGSEVVEMTHTYSARRVGDCPKR